MPSEYCPNHPFLCYNRMQKGIPNRILLKGEFASDQEKDSIFKEIKETWLGEWQELLKQCQGLLEKKLAKYYRNQWFWEEDWQQWGNHTWELFWGEGETIKEAMEVFEERKLSRNWTAINWVGESSSLSGADGIACPGIGGVRRKPKEQPWGEEGRKIKQFYRRLAFLLDGEKIENLDRQDKDPEGKFVAANEKLSIPELVKRLVTWSDVTKPLKMHPLENFNELKRTAKDNPHGDREQWTGWFMGDGDKREFDEVKKR